MPNYKGHLIGGLGIYCLLIVFLCAQWPAVSLALEWLLFTLLGSLFPDIDTKSKGQKLFYWLLLVMVIFLSWRGKWIFSVFLLCFGILPALVRHRGLFHRLWFVSLCGMIVTICISYIIPRCTKIIVWDMIFFMAGAISHLWLDMGWRRMIRIR